MSEKLPEMIVYEHEGKKYQIPKYVVTEPDSIQAHEWLAEYFVTGTIITLPNEVLSQVLAGTR